MEVWIARMVEAWGRGQRKLQSESNMNNFTKDRKVTASYTEVGRTAEVTKNRCQCDML